MVLSQWFSIVCGQGVCVSGPVFKSVLEELAKKLGHNDLKETDGCRNGNSCFGQNSRTILML